MTVLLALVPAALALGLAGLFAFLWALRNDQYGDLDGAAVRVLSDDDLPASEDVAANKDFPVKKETRANENLRAPALSRRPLGGGSRP